MKIGILDYIVGVGIFLFSLGIGIVEENPAYTLIFLGGGCIVYVIIKILAQCDWESIL